MCVSDRVMQGDVCAGPLCHLSFDLAVTCIALYCSCFDCCVCCEMLRGCRVG